LAPPREHLWRVVRRGRSRGRQGWFQGSPRGLFDETGLLTECWDGVPRCPPPDPVWPGEPDFGPRAFRGVLEGVPEGVPGVLPGASQVSPRVPKLSLPEHPSWPSWLPGAPGM